MKERVAPAFHLNILAMPRIKGIGNPFIMCTARFQATLDPDHHSIYFPGFTPTHPPLPCTGARLLPSPHQRTPLPFPALAPPFPSPTMASPLLSSPISFPSLLGTASHPSGPDLLPTSRPTVGEDCAGGRRRPGSGEEIGVEGVGGGIEEGRRGDGRGGAAPLPERKGEETGGTGTGEGKGGADAGEGRGGDGGWRRCRKGEGRRQGYGEKGEG